MTKGRVALPRRVVAGQRAFFITLGGPQAHNHSGRDDTFFLGKNAQKRPEDALTAVRRAFIAKPLGYLTLNL
jgi:hypothetical protein